MDDVDVPLYLTDEERTLWDMAIPIRDRAHITVRTLRDLARARMELLAREFDEGGWCHTRSCDASRITPVHDKTCVFHSLPRPEKPILMC